MPGQSRIVIAATAIALVVAIASCSSSHSSVAPPIVSTTAIAPMPTTGCASAGPERTVRHLVSPAGSVWVWIESAARPEFRVGSLVKIVWRMTGRGAPHAVLQRPDGRSGRLAFGPELHRVSTFRHPGAEYGTGFTPDSPGCWRFTMRRGDATGSVALLVKD